jgi:hypothetical protein
VAFLVVSKATTKWSTASQGHGSIKKAPKEILFYNTLKKAQN